MPRHVLFVQGAGQGTYDTWDNKLVRSLEQALGAGYVVHYPRMPDEGDPRYAAWKATLLEVLDGLDEGAVLVGHSAGGTLLLYALAEHPPRQELGGIALIAAPFLGEGGWPSDDPKPRPDLAERLPARVPVFLYHGTADREVPYAHVRLYAKALPRATVRTLEHRDHQLNDDLREVARDIASLTSRPKG